MTCAKIRHSPCSDRTLTSPLALDYEPRTGISIHENREKEQRTRPPRGIIWDRAANATAAEQALLNP